MNIQEFAKNEFLHAYVFKHNLMNEKKISQSEFDGVVQSLGLSHLDKKELKIIVSTDNTLSNENNTQLELEDGIGFIQEFINKEFNTQAGLNYTVYLLIQKYNQVYKRAAISSDFKFPENLFMQLRNLFISGAIIWDNGFIAKKDPLYISVLDKFITQNKKIKADLLTSLLSEFK